MENSIPIPQGKPGMEWNGMEWNLEYSMVEPTSRYYFGFGFLFLAELLVPIPRYDVHFLSWIEK